MRLNTDTVLLVSYSPVTRSYSTHGISGSDSTFSGSGGTREEALAGLTVGGIFLDWTPVEPDTFRRGIIAGPMLDVRQIAPVSEPLNIPDHMTGPGGLADGFLALAKLHKDTLTPDTLTPETAGALDTLSVAAYVDYWLARGATAQEKTATGWVAV